MIILFLHQIDEEINLLNDKFIFEEKFNKGNNNETIDTIPINEERSVGDTCFWGDIHELLLKIMMTKKKNSIIEEFNISSSKSKTKFIRK